jgi:TRAP-type C4-dicarboxylate transport system permease small subunit
MVSKDQAIGGVICFVCVIVAALYIIGLFGYQWITQNLSALAIFGTDAGAVQFWLVAIPVLVGFVAILAIGAWIGWTMATTPPPKPIEEITTEMEEKKEEPKMEEMKSEEPAAGTMAEEKKPDKKKKS